MRVVLDSLGEDIHLVPEAVHLTPITYELPYYIVHAVKVQAMVEPMPHRVIRPATVSDYLADFLHRSIDPDTLTILRRDPTFRAAFDFVDGRDT